MRCLDIVLTIGDQVIKEGQWLSLNGSTGEVILGKQPVAPPAMSSDLETFMAWADQVRRLKVMANAETPNDALTARNNGAQGIGLCRTEHMFFASDERIKAVRQMIMAATLEQRKEALYLLLHSSPISIFQFLLKTSFRIIFFKSPFPTHRLNCDLEMRRGIKSHRILKDRAMNRVDDLQCMFMDLQSARKEKRKIDMVVLEEQVHQMLKEWKKELTEPSFPASSFQQGGSLGSFSPDITRLLQLYDEEDDATSGLPAPKPDPDVHNDTEISAFHKNFVVTPVFQEQGFKLLDQYKDSPLEINTTSVHNMGVDYFSFDLPHEYENNCIGGVYDMYGEDGLPQITNFLPNICPPPSAFFGPKCALWDCPRPAQGWWSETPVQWWCTNYCSSLHAVIAQNEGQPGMIPILRPKGIELKDNLLFTALSAKGQGKNVGIPECEGAATAKSPWNAPELFDLLVFEGESLREWLFFDKPRRAFESGNRKQRSLPDYNGRGWHESRKQVINESGWLKRSYYMDPQPMKFLEWHLYEYEINKYDSCALYRLELKLVDKKKSPKGKITNTHRSRYLGQSSVI